MAGLIIRTKSASGVFTDYLTLTAAERSAPQESIDYGLKVNYSKYELPGQVAPRYQIMSACYQPFVVKGELISQWLGNQTPPDMIKKMEKLIFNGEKVEIQIDNDPAFGSAPILPAASAIIWNGYFTDLKVKYYSALRIGYELEFSPFDMRADATFKPLPKLYGFSISSIFGIISLIKDLAAQTRATIFGGGFPLPHMVGEFATELRVFLATIDNKIEVINDTFNKISTGYANMASPEVTPQTDGTGKEVSALVQPFQNSLTSTTYSTGSGGTAPNSQLQLQKLSSACIDLSKTINTFRKVTLADNASDDSLDTTDTIVVAQFDESVRSLRAGIVTFESKALQAQKYTLQYINSDAIDFYRPSASESIYAISLKYYGTPFNWRLIADRNNLSSNLFTGEELLIIPKDNGRG